MYRHAESQNFSPSSGEGTSRAPESGGEALGLDLLERGRFFPELPVMLGQVEIDTLPVGLWDVDAAPGAGQDLHRGSDTRPHDLEPSVDQLVVRQLVGLFLMWGIVLCILVRVPGSGGRNGHVANTAEGLPTSSPRASKTLG